MVAYYFTQRTVFAIIFHLGHFVLLGGGGEAFWLSCQPKRSGWWALERSSPPQLWNSHPREACLAVPLPRFLKLVKAEPYLQTFL